MLSTEEFWSRKQFDPAGPNSTNNPGVIPSNNIEQWLIARQRIGKQNNDASNENWKGREYNRIIKNMKSYSKFECISLLFRAECLFEEFCCRLQKF